MCGFDPWQSFLAFRLILVLRSFNWLEHSQVQCHRWDGQLLCRVAAEGQEGEDDDDAMPVHLRQEEDV